jgi:uncharacterized protein (TIGR03435 family)
MFRICFGLAFAVVAWAQGADDRATFEVASVKPARDGPSRMSGGPGTPDPDRFTATNAELSWLVVRAFGLDGWDRFTGPAWIDTATFDVVAKIPPGTTSDQFRKMLQKLLAERFRMQVHHETRILPVYELTVATNGPKLKLAAVGSGTDDFVPGSGVRPADRDGFPILPAGLSNVSCAHLAQGSYCTYRMSAIELLAQRLAVRRTPASLAASSTKPASQASTTLRSISSLVPLPRGTPQVSGRPFKNSLA